MGMKMISNCKECKTMVTENKKVEEKLKYLQELEMLMKIKISEYESEEKYISMNDPIKKQIDHNKKLKEEMLILQNELSTLKIQIACFSDFIDFGITKEHINELMEIHRLAK